MCHGSAPQVVQNMKELKIQCLLREEFLITETEEWVHIKKLDEQIIKAIKKVQAN